MKKIVAITLCVTGLLVPAVVWADYKKDYCGGEEYVGNTGSVYPHLHCGKNFFTFSWKSNSKKNLHEGQGAKGAGCKRAAEILADQTRYLEHAGNAGAITGALQAFIAAECQ